MNRAEAKRHIKATTYQPKMGIGHTRKKSKAAQSAELERDIAEFLANDGEIRVIENQPSTFRPAWEAYATGAFEDRSHEA